MVLPFGARIILQVLFREAMEQALHFARQADERIPGPVYREIVAAGINDADFAPELRQRAQHLQFAGEELLVKHRERNVLLDAVHAAQAQPEVIDIAAEYAPDGAALCAARQCLHRRGRFSVVRRRRVARHHDAIRREIRSQAPGIFPISRRHFAGIFGRPTHRRCFPHLRAQFPGEVGIGLGMAGALGNTECFGS